MPPKHMQPNPLTKTCCPQLLRTQLEAHYKNVYRHAQKLTRNTADAKDLAQDVMVKAMLYADAGKMYENGSLAAWLHKTTHTTFVDRMRRAHNRVEVSGYDGEWDEKLTTTLPAPNHDLRMDVLAMLKDVGDDSEMLTAVYVEGILYREYSAQKGIAMGSVMRRLYNARMAARAWLANAA